MKLRKLTAILISLFVVGCDVETNKSTTSSVDSSTSFVDNSSTDEIILENKLIDIENNSNLNSLNGYEGLTPSTGDVNILLIPIHFKNINNNLLDTTLINKAFNSINESDVEYYSVKEYYKISSYEKLNLNFEITDTYIPSESSTFYSNSYNNSNYPLAVQSIIEEALSFFDDKYDYSNFDSNKDGYIDGIYLIYDAPVDYQYKEDLWWAWTSYNLDENIIFDDMKYKSYVFAGMEFLKQDNRNCNTHTLIHETAHMFGIDDYYDYNAGSGTKTGGLAKADMMDGTIGDHNPFTKSLLNWSNGKLVNIEDDENKFTVELESFSENGNYLILANDFDLQKGILQEYFILEYYRPTNLNEFDKMFTINGVRMLHVVADTKKNGTFKYNNATTNVKLISQITTSNGDTYISDTTDRSDDTLFVENEKLTKVNYANGSLLNYSFEIIELSDNKATISIEKK